MKWQNIIELAREIAATQPSDHLGMAAGNAYYAMYHALARSNADLLVGHPKRRLACRSGAASTSPWAATPQSS